MKRDFQDEEVEEWRDRNRDHLPPDPCIHGPGVAYCGHPDCTGWVAYYGVDSALHVTRRG